MAFDVFTIAALVDELTETLVGGRVQNIIDVDALGIGLEIYAAGQRHYLYLSAAATAPRAHLGAAKLRRGLTKPTQLGLLCRRYIDGAVLEKISQPAWERLLEIELRSPEGGYKIVAELMPRRANVLLLRDGMILDCLNRVGPEDNRYRLSLPNHKYVPPPPLRGQFDPGQMTAADLAQLLASAKKPTTQTRRLLPGRILGLSPLLAKEIVFRATGAVATKVGDTDADALFSALRAVVEPLLRREWQPGLGLLDGLPTEFSAYPLTHLTWQACASLSEAVSACFCRHSWN